MFCIKQTMAETMITDNYTAMLTYLKWPSQEDQRKITLFLR